MSANGLSERLQTPISTAELQRRWGLVRQAMEREKIDVLLMQNNNDHMGGAVKWFTDMPACNGYPMTVVFPRDDEMTVVMQGPFNGDSRPPADMWRGVKRMLTTPSYESAHYTNILRSRARRESAGALRQRDDRLRPHLPALVRARRLHHEESFPARVTSTPARWSTASR